MIKPPSGKTLKKYGLSIREWRSMIDGQGGVCSICRLSPKSGRLCIDHEHVFGWKKMPPGNRKIFVRGLLCWRCNHYYLSRGMSVERATNVAKYLLDYALRKEGAVVDQGGRPVV